MTASIVRFPSRGRYSCREHAAYESATVAGERRACITRLNSRTENLARKVIVARYQIPSFPPPDGPLADEASAYCCSLVGPFIDRRGRTVDFKNFSRRFKAPGSLLLSALQAGKQTARCISKCFRSFSGFVLGHVEQSTEGPRGWNEKPFPNPTTVLPRMK